MAKPEWGRKRTCQVCGKKFYDLNKSPIICPCPEAVEFDPDIYLKTRKGKNLSTKAVSEEIEIEDDISFISDDEISEEDDIGDDDVTVEVIDDSKD